MTPRGSRALRMVAVGALTAGLLGAWLALVDRRALGAALADAHVGWVAAVAALSLVHLAIRAARWQAMLAAATEAPAWGPLFRWTAIGYALSFVVPGRPGEVVRPALASLRGRVPLGLALGSAVLERLLDVATLALLFGAYAVLAPEAPPGMRASAAVLLAAAALSGVVALAVAHRRRDLVARVIAWSAERAPGRLRPRARSLAAGLVSTTDVMTAAGAWWRLPAWSLATWLPVVLALDASVRAMRLDLPPTAALLLVALTALGIAVPTPAGVGGYHAAMTYGLAQVLGVPSGTAAAAAVLAHGASVVPVLLAGLVAAWVEGLSPADLRRVRGAAAPATMETPSPAPGRDAPADAE